MSLSDYVNTFGQQLLKQYGERIHKVTINAEFTCPNRDGSKGIGGCTFCNNVSFNPNARKPPTIAEQIQAGRQVIKKRTGATKYIAYFQAYTNTYAEANVLRKLYDTALQEPDVIGLSIGTRPDCVPDQVLDLLANYQQQGYEIWLELGLQSAFDETLKKVNRGHGFQAYADTVLRAQKRNLKICTHLIAGLPDETAWHVNQTLQKVLTLGTNGLKLHPLHVVKGTQLANQWRQNQYLPLSMEAYVDIASAVVQQTPKNICFHRLTGTASPNILLAPDWCSKKWLVLNAIENKLKQRLG